MTKFQIGVLVTLCMLQGHVFGDYPSLAHIPGGEFEMGDHHDLGGAEHRNDEVPVHTVRVDSFLIGIYEITNQHYVDYLSDAFKNKKIMVQNGFIYPINGTNPNDGSEIYCETLQAVNYSRIDWDGATFQITPGKENHPVIGVRWFGAIAYCNWLSEQHSLQTCYDLATGQCDFTKNGYRLPTEAEWEYAGRGGLYDPYCIFPWGDDFNENGTRANWPNSGDPYEAGDYPFTTPVGFYDGELHQKTDFGWPGSQESYQTADGSNAYGLYDMSGNVWEWVYDWYTPDYYAESESENPHGPTSGKPMPDGKPYRVLRGGNWFNGEQYWGHSRVSNRNPSYYRGPDDPIHAWYHIGFRIARNFDTTATDVKIFKAESPDNFELFQNYPNPFNPTTTIRYQLTTSSLIKFTVYNVQGNVVKILVNQIKVAGQHSIDWDGTDQKGRHVSSGIYLYQLESENKIYTKKMILVR